MDEVKLLPCEPTPEMASAGMHILAALPAETDWPELARAACDVWRAMFEATRPTLGTGQLEGEGK